MQAALAPLLTEDNGVKGQLWLFKKNKHFHKLTSKELISFMRRWACGELRFGDFDFLRYLLSFIQYLSLYDL